MYTKTDAVTTTVNVGSANQQSVSFVVRNRVSLNAPNQNAEGLLTVDDATVSISRVARCR